MTGTILRSEAAPRRGTPARRWRQLLVWLHVVSSVSWLSQSAALAVLLFTAAAPGPGRVGAVETARLLDGTVLLHSANVSTVTGMLLSATTSWGFFRHRWVTVKFVTTIAALFVGIAVLSARMDGAVAAVRAGDGGPAATLGGVAVLMASAFGLLVWLSVAKPGGRFRRHGPRTTAPAVTLAVAVLAPLVDVAIGITLGTSVPVLSLTTVAVAAILRRRAPGQPASALVGR